MTSDLGGGHRHIGDAYFSSSVNAQYTVKHYTHAHTSPFFYRETLLLIENFTNE